MIVYKDRSFCLQDCGNYECIRNKRSIPWDNLLPVSFIKCSDCINWESTWDRDTRDCYEREDNDAKD